MAGILVVFANPDHRRVVTNAIAGLSYVAPDSPGALQRALAAGPDAYSVAIFDDQFSYVNGQVSATLPSPPSTAEGLMAWLRASNQDYPQAILLYANAEPAGIRRLRRRYPNLASCALGNTTALEIRTAVDTFIKRQGP